MASSFAFESDQSIDSPDRVPSSAIGAACAVHKEQYQQFALFILFGPIQIALREIVAELRILFEKA